MTVMKKSEKKVEVRKKNTDVSVLLLHSKCGDHHKFHTQNHPDIGMKEVKVIMETKG